MKEGGGEEEKEGEGERGEERERIFGHTVGREGAVID